MPHRKQRHRGRGSKAQRCRDSIPPEKGLGKGSKIAELELVPEGLSATLKMTAVSIYWVLTMC